MNNPKKQPRRDHPQSTVNTRAGTRHRDPLTYRHPYDSMRRYAELLALRHDSPRTRHSYYRAMRLVHEHFQCDRAAITEDHPIIIPARAASNAHQYPNESAKWKPANAKMIGVISLQSSKIFIESF